MSLADRLKELGDAKGRGWQAALARACGVKAPSVADWVSGKTKSLDGTNLLNAANFFGVHPTWLATGKGTKWVKPGTHLEAVGEALEEPFLPGFEKVSVPVLAAAGSMGTGSEQHDDVVVGRLSLSPQWVTKTLRPLTKLENLRFIHGYGDSMEPTFFDGDILLVDAGVPDVKVDGIYVLEANQRLYVKRVRQRIDGTFEISSDNPTVKTVDVLTSGQNEVSVKGRVIWVWNGKKI